MQQPCMHRRYDGVASTNTDCPLVALQSICSGGPTGPHGASMHLRWQQQEGRQQCQELIFRYATECKAEYLRSLLRPPPLLYFPHWPVRVLERKKERNPPVGVRKGRKWYAGKPALTPYRLLAVAVIAAIPTAPAAVATPTVLPAYPGGDMLQGVPDAPPQVVLLHC